MWLKLRRLVMGAHPNLGVRHFLKYTAVFSVNG